MLFHPLVKHPGTHESEVNVSSFLMISSSSVLSWKVYSLYSKFRTLCKDIWGLLTFFIKTIRKNRADTQWQNICLPCMRLFYLQLQKLISQKWSSELGPDLPSPIPLVPSFSFVHLLPQYPLTHRCKYCIQICICYNGLGLNINS